jgi:hypothetical protein
MHILDLHDKYIQYCSTESRNRDTNHISIFTKLSLIGGGMNTYIIKGDPVPLARPRFNAQRIWDSQKNHKLHARP